jgi:uncharacterized membrane protein
MLTFNLLYTLHVLAAVIWVGGMFFAWVILRPVAAARLQGPARLQLWEGIFPRFFSWVWLCVSLLPISGVAMLHLRYHGFDGAPRYVQLMMGLYVVMVALFLRVQGLQLPALRKAVAAEDWSAGASVMGRIRLLVGANLLLGMGVVALGAARPWF